LADNDLERRLVLALFAPQTEAPSLPSEAYDFGGARMLAYFATVPVNEDPGTEANYGANIGMRRAAELGLWEAGKVAPAAYDFATTLRWPAPAPGQPTPAMIGRRAGDYYLSRYGVPDLSQATRGRSDAGAVLPVYGTPGQPNLQFPGELILGQTLPDGKSLLLHQATATSATTTVGSPAAGIHLLSTNATGALAANLFSGTDWSGWVYIGGPILGKAVIADNPRRGSRILYAVDAITRELFVNRYPEAGSDPPTYDGWRSIGVQIQGTPVVAIDPATGNETVAFNDASGQTTIVTVSTGAPRAVLLPGNAKLTNLALAYAPGGLVVFGYEGDQLRQSVAGPDGTFSPLANVGPAAANRAPVAPLARFNPVAGQLEVLAAGANGALSLTHVKLGATRAEDTVSAPVNVGISTDTTPGMAVNTDTGDVMVLARSADLPVPEGEKLNPTAGQALTAVFRNSSGAFDPPSRIGIGLMPPGASPDVVYNPGTKQYERFVIGEDFQLYRNIVAP
jgi:hypothetical protein